MTNTSLININKEKSAFPNPPININKEKPAFPNPGVLAHLCGIWRITPAREVSSQAHTQGRMPWACLSTDVSSGLKMPLCSQS